MRVSTWMQDFYSLIYPAERLGTHGHQDFRQVIRKSVIVPATERYCNSPDAYSHILARQLPTACFPKVQRHVHSISVCYWLFNHMRSHQTLLCPFVIVTSMKNISLQKHCVNHCSLFCLLIMKEYFGRDQKLDENQLEPVNVWEIVRNEVRNCFCWRLCVKKLSFPPAGRWTTNSRTEYPLALSVCWTCARTKSMPNRCTVS